MLVSFSLVMSFDCEACRTSIPVNGIVGQITCHQCGQQRTIDSALWRELFTSGEVLDRVLRFSPGQTDYLPYAYRRATYGPRAPQCARCKADLEPDALAPLTAQGSCACPGCGQPVRLRDADDLCRAAHPRAMFVVGETATSAEMQALDQRREPVLFACMKCAAALPVDGSTRTVKCEYCGASSYLPDGLWRELNPVPVPVVFFLVCGYDDAALRHIRWSRSDERATDASSAGLTEALYEELARDDSSDVLCALAGNQAAPPAVLARLTTSTRPDVLRALAGNPSLPAEALAGMAASPLEHARAAAVDHPALPLELLRTLARDDDDHVKERAVQRLEQLRAAGVDVGGGGGGFFRRLFGD